MPNEYKNNTREWTNTPKLNFTIIFCLIDHATKDQANASNDKCTFYSLTRSYLLRE